MEEILTNAWAQYGALGALTVTGWVMWWYERRERIRLRIKNEELIERLFTFVSDQKDLLEKIAESLSLRTFIEKELEKMRGS